MKQVKYTGEGAIMVFFEAVRNKSYLKDCHRLKSRIPSPCTSDRVIVDKFQYNVESLKVFRYHNGRKYHQKYFEKALQRIRDIVTLL